MENYMFMESVKDKDETESLADSKSLPAEVEEWEFETGGRLLLELYKRKVISRSENWFVSKGLMKRELDRFLAGSENKELRERLKQRLGNFNVGTLLDRGKFLINTKRGCGKYRINYERLFGMEMLELIDKNYLFHSKITQDEIKLQMDKNSNSSLLEYVGTDMQVVEPKNDTQKKWRCTICQTYFEYPVMLRYHVQEHGVDNQIVWAKNFIKFDDSIIKVSAQLSSDMKKVFFKIACCLSNKPNLMIEQVILVKAYSLYTVPISSTPLAANNCFFSVDVGMLNDCNKHRFVFIIRDEIKKTMRIAEQHNYMHTKVQTTSSTLIGKAVLDSKKNFIMKESLQSYELDEQLTKPFKNSVSIVDLKKLSPEFADYMKNNKKLSMQNIQGALKILLQMEDLHRCFIGSVVQKQVKLAKIGNDYTFKLSDAQNIYLETLLNENNQVFLRYLPGKSQHDDINLGLSTFIKPDQELLRILKSSNSKVYLGNVAEVNNGSIVFTSPHSIPLNQEYLIVIRPLRNLLCLQYRALEKLRNFSALDMSRFFFPQFVQATYKDLPRTCIILHNGKIYKDPEQLQAVQNICDGLYRDDTYIVEGPAGSGKTSVLIESIMQLYEKNQNNKILVLANTENAVDLLATPLSQLLKQKHKISDMARIYSYLHKYEVGNEVAEEQQALLEASNIQNKHFYPAVAELHNKRIVLTTACVAGLLALGNFGRDCNSRPVFNYIFVDNATTLTEPELLVALINVLSPTASLILAGDRNQLGPKVYSTRACDLGLGVSLMERLLQYDCYQISKDATIQSNSVYTCLQNNYRSHPALVEMCTEMFHYKTKPMANIVEVTTACNWYKLANPYSPYLYHHIPTDNMQVTSDLNLGALDLVLQYLKEIKYFGIDDKEISDKDIGVITNYNWETKFLRDELRMRHWQGIQVDTFPNFCGQEKQVIFCLMTLNNTYFATMYNGRNLNSIITRAKSLIVFFGNIPAMKNNDYLINLIAACNRRKMLIINNEVVDFKSQFDKLGLEEQPNGLNVPNKGAIPKSNAMMNKPHQRGNVNSSATHLSQQMKKGYAGKNAQVQQKNNEKLKEMLQPDKKNQQKSPVENLFKNTNKETFSKKNTNEGKLQKKAQEKPGTKYAPNINKNQQANKPNEGNPLKVQNKVGQQPQQQQEFPATINAKECLSHPLQISLQFPNLMHMPNPTVQQPMWTPPQQQLYPTPPIFPEFHTQCPPPSYQEAVHRPSQEFRQKKNNPLPSAPPRSEKPIKEFRVASDLFDQNKKNSKKDGCIIA